MKDVDFVSFAHALDRCWMEGRFPDLHQYLAEDVVFVAAGGTPRSEGIEHAIESYRQFTSQAQVSRFETSDPIVTHRGDTAILEYRWRMAWTASGAEYLETGRDVLVFARRAESWRVVWRTQIPAPPD